MFEIKKTVLATLACLSLTVTAVQAAETVRIEECGKAATASPSWWMCRVPCSALSER